MITIAITMTTFVRKFDYRGCPTIGAIDVSISQIPTIARIGGGGGGGA